MRLETQRHDQLGTVIAVHGDMALEHRAAMRGALRSAVEQDLGVALDLRDVTFVDSSGVAVIVSARRLTSERNIPFAVIVDRDSYVFGRLERLGLLGPVGESMFDDLDAAAAELAGRRDA